MSGSPAQEETDWFVREALAANVEIGRGGRRVCLAVPGRDDLCVKRLFVRGDASEGSRARKMYAERFSKAKSVVYREWRYLRHLRRRAPESVLRAFPSFFEVSLNPEYGWVGLMERVRNADGGAPVRLSEAAVTLPDRAEIVSSAKALMEEIARCGVSYYDVKTTMVQRRADGSFALRIIDFEQHGELFGMGFEYLKPRWMIAHRVRHHLYKWLARLEEIKKGE